MIYDLYVTKPQGDVTTQLRLLVTEEGKRATGKFVTLVHGERQKDDKLPPSQYDRYIENIMPTLASLHLKPTDPDFSLFPPGSWFLQFEFTLAKPWMSKDDDPFYVAASVNPVRKDKVFKVPFMAASSWKGLLRWTLMHIRLTQKNNELSPQRFAQERFVQTLLFGDEQGEEPGRVKGFAEYLNALNPEARAEYERLLRRHFGVDPKDPLPHHSGRLYFYPTFFDQIDVEVINPHSRQTRAGINPIYLECVPEGAKGTFSLLYVPFDLIGRNQAEIKEQALADLQLVAEGIEALFLTYGFSAKRTSGYGVAKENVENGFVCLRMEGISPPPVAPSPAAEPSLPKYLQAPGKLKDEYLNPDGTFRERSQAELAKMSKSQRQEYEKAKKWWEREGKALAEKPAEPVLPEQLPKPQPQWLKREFSSLDELLSIAENLAQGGEA
ncbi:MAG: RAMP superfamily CRISPR-associated protein [Anaerolineales bacterium]